MRTLFLAGLGLACLSPAAAAGEFDLTPGFNLESVPSPSSFFAVLNDGTVLRASGSFGDESLLAVQPDGSTAVFATGFGSLAGLAQSELSGEIVVGDSFFSPSLWSLDDLNDDGDALDPGEMVPFAVQPPVLSNGAAPLPFALIFAPGTDDLYMSGSTPFGIEPALGVVTRTSGGSAAVFGDGMGFPGNIVFSGGDLYVADLDSSTFAGRVITLTDGNGDDDALDVGEAVDFASGLSGAGGLVQAADGSFYLSGMSDGVDFSGCVGRLLPDLSGDGISDGLEECVFDGFTFSGGLSLIEGPGGFTPGAAGMGTLYVGDFTFSGDRTIRTAPVATTTVTGTVGPNSLVTISVGGTPGSGAIFGISLDVNGSTISGIGDLGFGFGAPAVLSPVFTIDPAGAA
ncbi:MAG: hypothetical protein ACI9EF_001240, partial [Pseudohongiellaceae bacterium]